MSNTTATAPVPLTKSTGDWIKDKKASYTAAYEVPTYIVGTNPPEVDKPDYFEGPEDAFVWFGQPWEGQPYSNEEEDPITGEMVKCRTFLDPNKYSKSLGGVDVKWIAWDKDTQCNVYQRIVEEKELPNATAIKGHKGTMTTEDPIAAKVAEVEDDGGL